MVGGARTSAGHPGEPDQRTTGKARSQVVWERHLAPSSLELLPVLLLLHQPLELARGRHARRAVDDGVLPAIDGVLQRLVLGHELVEARGDGCGRQQLGSGQVAENLGGGGEQTRGSARPRASGQELSDQASRAGAAHLEQDLGRQAEQLLATAAVKKRGRLEGRHGPGGGRWAWARLLGGRRRGGSSGGSRRGRRVRAHPLG